MDITAIEDSLPEAALITEPAKAADMISITEIPH
jgi:hypothetical protein